MIVNKNPIITVLMPVYNCEAYVKEALESILNQTYCDFELLVIDDASTDLTTSIVKAYNDSRIQLIEKSKNSGYTNSLNYGLSIAKGKYIARMDGDDISFPERFAKQVAFLESNPEVSLCGSLFAIIGSQTVVTVPEYHDEIKLTLLSHCCFGHPTVMIRKKTLEQFSLSYDSKREPAEDYDLWSKISVIGKLHNLQEVLLNYRIHNSQVSQKRADQQIKNAVEIKFKLLCNLEFESSLKEQDLLCKIFKRDSFFSYLELKQFQGLKCKLIKANEVNFFETKGFNKYLEDLEYNIYKEYFFKRSKYSPIIFYQYIRIKGRKVFKLNLFNELKLLLKSAIFYKNK